MSRDEFIQVARTVPFDNNTSGMTSTNVQASIEEVDNEINIQNMIWVKQNPGHKDFSSIVSALASITTASSSNPFIVKVAAGVYTENNPIVMKPYVYVVGESPGRAIQIVAQNPNSDLITGADSSVIRNCLLTGSTGSGASLIKYTPASDLGLFVADRIRFGAGDTLCKASAGTYKGFLRCNTPRIGEGFIFDKGFLATTTGSEHSHIIVSDLFCNKLESTSPTYIAYASGANCQINFLTGEIETHSIAPVSTFAKVDNGGILEIFGVRIEGFATGIATVNTGAAPKIEVSGVSIAQSTTDINIAHTGTIGSLSGIFTKSKIVNSAPYTTQLAYQDPVTGDFNTTRILATRGFATDLTTITTSGATTQILSTDAHVYVALGSTGGEILKLPNATTLRNGHEYLIINGATVQVTIQDFSGANGVLINSGFSARYILRDNSTSAGIWMRAVTSSSVFSGTAPVLASYGGNANTGRYLEIWPGLSSDVDPFVIPVYSAIVGLVLGAEAASTGTLSVYKTSDLSTPIAAISLTAQTENILTTLNVSLNALDKLAFKVSSGTISKPRFAIYLSAS